MVARLIKSAGAILGLIICVHALAGCGEAPPPPETAESKSAANAQASTWTEEQKQKFAEAMKGHALTAKGGITKDSANDGGMPGGKK